MAASPASFTLTTFAWRNFLAAVAASVKAFFLPHTFVNVRVSSPSMDGKNNMQPFQAIQKYFFLFFQRQISPFVSLKVQRSGNYSSLSVALWGHRTELGWLRAWQNIDSLSIKRQFLLCFTLYQFRHTLFLLSQSFLSLSHSFNFFPPSGKMTPGLISDEQNQHPPSSHWMGCLLSRLNWVIQSQLRWTPLTEHFSSTDDDWFWNFNFPKKLPL